MTTPTDEARAIAKRLTKAARVDARDGNCIMGGETCICGSTAKGEFAEHRLADFPENPDAGCLLNRRGLAVRVAILEEGA